MQRENPARLRIERHLFLGKVKHIEAPIKMASIGPLTLARFAEKAFIKNGIKVLETTTVIHC
jgi:hypothetical protein